MNENKFIPNISVIIPCYNCEKWIEKCLIALEKQTYKNFEVICVDDCSTDDTKKILMKYYKNSNLKIKIIENKKNSGPAISRNNAMMVAQGTWFAFCDSDDWYDETYLEEMLIAAENDNSDIVMCEYRKIYNNKKSKNVNYLSNVNNDSSIEIKLVYSKSSLCLLLIKSKLLISTPIPNLRNGEDVACIPCIEARAKNISIVKKPLYNYLMRVSSSSNKPSESVYKSLLLSFDYIEKNFPSYYLEVLEFFGIRSVLYGVTINAFKAGVSTHIIRKIVEEFTVKYPKWHKNKYIITLSRIKLLYLKFLHIRMYSLCRLLAFIHLKLSV